MDHFADFGCCSLLENHPECAEYEVRFVLTQDYLKELTELFIKYSFDAAEDSPFFQGMNYNGRYCGFSNNSYSFSYREWLPNVSQAFLEGPCNKPNPRQYELTNDGNSFFELTVEEHFETFADGDTVPCSITEDSVNLNRRAGLEAYVSAAFGPSAALRLGHQIVPRSLQPDVED